MVAEILKPTNVFPLINFLFGNLILILQKYLSMEAAVNALVVEAFDIKNAANVANDVYEQNFGHRPYQVLIVFSIILTR